MGRETGVGATNSSHFFAKTGIIIIKILLGSFENRSMADRSGTLCENNVNYSIFWGVLIAKGSWELRIQNDSIYFIFSSPSIHTLTIERFMLTDFCALQSSSKAHQWKAHSLIKRTIITKNSPPKKWVVSFNAGRYVKPFFPLRRDWGILNDRCLSAM